MVLSVKYASRQATKSRHGGEGGVFEVARGRAPARGPSPLAPARDAGHPMKGGHPLQNPRFEPHPLLEPLVTVLAPLSVPLLLTLWRRGCSANDTRNPHKQERFADHVMCVPKFVPTDVSAAPAWNSVRRGSYHAISDRPGFQFGGETLCPEQACEINRTTGDLYGMLATVL